MVTGGLDKWPILDPIAIRDRYGVGPESYVDYAVLRGDPSDGLPGLPGIGDKTAASLIAAFGSLEGLVTATHQPPVKPLTPRLSGVVVEGRDYIAAARRVVAVRTDLDVPRVVGPLPRAPLDPERLAHLAREWGVERFVDEAVVAAQTALA